MRVRAPGRVNLIGGHVDFHDGPVVTAAIDREVLVDIGSVGSDVVELTSDHFPGVVSVHADGSEAPADVRPRWGRLAAAVLAELAALGRPPTGFGGRVSSTLPIGGGLSSSAAFEVAIATAASAAAGWSTAPLDLAQACRRAELAATGVPCGLQDPAASVLGGVVRLDCRDLSVEPLSLPDGTGVLVVDSGVSRTLEGSPWTERRTASFAAAERLGVGVLRDVPPGTPLDDPHARHVVGEIERVWRFADALRASDASAAGRLMVESHASSRDLWRSSTAELDWLVEHLVAAGAHGARLTGGGFGGCVVALVPADRSPTIGAEVVDDYRRRFSIEATAHHVEVVDGASVAG
jgi:galactokinase